MVRPFRFLLPLLAASALAQEPDVDPVVFAVSGRALDGQREPVAGLVVAVWDALAPDRFLGQGATGPKGRFLVALRASALARREHACGPLLLAAGGRGVAHVRTIVPAASRDVILTVEPEEVIQGTITNADGTPLPALVVRGAVLTGAEPPEGRSWVETTTGEDGRYALRGLSAQGECRIEVVGDGFVFRARGGGTLALPRFRHAAARVLDAASGSPIADARLQVPLPAGRLVVAVTDAEGRLDVMLPEEPEGSIVAEGYAPRGVRLEFGDELDVRLQPAQPLGGLVVDADGRGLPGCHVTLRHRSLGVQSAWTDARGRYAFASAPRGMVDLAAVRPGYLLATVRTRSAAGDRLTLRLSKGATVAGRVTRDGNPAVGVRVGVWAAGREVAFAYTDTRGRFLVEGVPPGAERLFASEEGRRSPSVELAAPADEAALGPFPLELRDHLPLRGVLRSDAGHPLAGVVLADAVDDRLRARTDAEGRFDFGSLPLADYLVVGGAPDHEPLLRTLRPGDDHEIVLASRFGASTLRVGVVLPERLGAVRVEVHRREVPRVRRATDGEPVFKALPAGTYDVSVRAEGYLEAREVVQVRDGGEASVEVRPQQGGTLRLTATPGAVVAVLAVDGRPPPVAALELGEGTRELRGFGPGTYRFIARARGELLVVKETALGPDEPPVDLDLRGGAASTLDVTVTNGVGEPVEGADLTLVSQSGFSWNTRVRTDARGKATLERLIAGRIEVFATRGNRTGAAALEVGPGTDLSIAIVVR